MDENNIEVWGYKTFRPFRIYWILYEYELKFSSFKIGSRTGETQTANFLKMNPKGKIPILKHKENIITESAAAVFYVTYQFKKPKDFFIPTTSYDKAKVEEWCYFSLMELDCLGIYILRRHENPEKSGLSNLYGEAPNATMTARKHFEKMIQACEKQVPKDRWLFGDSPSVADIMFTSCLLHTDRFNLKINSDNVESYYNFAKKRKSFLDAYNDCFEI